MFGSLGRENTRLRSRLAAAADRATDLRTYIGVLTTNQARLAQRQARLIGIVAEAITTVAARPNAKAVADHLQQQLLDAGFRAELEYALLRIERAEAAS